MSRACLASGTSSAAPESVSRPICTPASRFSAPMATFAVQFLGCKVSHTDAHEIRERLLRDGHSEAAGDGDVAVVNTCCVTHEAVRKSRQAAARASRTHTRVYVTGCAANLAGDAFRDLPAN